MNRTQQRLSDSDAEAIRPQLALYGGPKALTRSQPPMFPGGLEVGDEEWEAVSRVVRSKRLIRHYGPDESVTSSSVDEFELEFAAYVDADYALAVSSGTAALITGLAAAGIGPGDEVIVPAYTFVASPSAVLAVGALPIITEVDDSLTLDPEAVLANITPYTRAIMPVHMRGVPAQMDRLSEVAKQHGLQLIEDCAQAAGATYRGRKVGSLGDVGCFSFQIHKIITTGEGGMVVTGDQEIIFRAKCFHDSASEWRGAAWQDPDPEVRATFQAFPGMNFKMAAVPGAIGRVQLARLDGILSRMRANKAFLADTVARTGRVQLQRLPDAAGDAATALIFFVEAPDLAAVVVDALRAEGVTAKVLYVPGEQDWHVYACWRDILAKRTWNRAGYPFCMAQRPIEYDEAMCPQSLSYLARAVHLDVSPQLSAADLDETAEALDKVITALC